MRYTLAISQAKRRVAAISLEDAVALLPYTTGSVAAFAIGLVSVKTLRTPTFPYFTPIVVGAVASLVLSVVISYCFRRHSTLPAWLDRSGLASWVLSVQGGVLLLVLPLLALTVSTHADDVGNWTFGFLNKRWLIALYNVTVVAVVILPLGAARMLSCSFDEMPSEPTRRRRSRRRSLVDIAVIVFIVWYFAGPPWHLDRHHRPIDWHEQAHLGSLQAIAKGYVPYIGPASTQYGPGSQLLMYGIMRTAGPFDIVSFRTAWATFNFVGLAIVALIAYLWRNLWLTLAVIFLELAYSPFASFFTAGDGTFGGFYGWANALRYLAPLIVVPALARLAGARPARVRPQASIGVGVVWGIGAWLAQESLSTTVWAGSLLMLALILTRTLRPIEALQIGAWLIVGFVGVITPVLLAYATHGATGELLRNYFLMPRAVAAGYSNIWWPAVDRGRPDIYSYYLTLPFLLLIALATLWRWPSLRPMMPLDTRRCAMLAFTLVLLAAYQTALFRSDYSHLMNTMIALPFVLVCGAMELPRFLSHKPHVRWAIRFAFIAVAGAVFPALPLRDWSGLVRSPGPRFRAHTPATSEQTIDNGVAFRRATGPLSHEPEFAGGAGLSMQQFLEFAEDVHRIVGSRKTYVGDLGWRAWPGAVYFLADLTPAPYPLDRLTLTLNDELRSLVANHIRMHPTDYECFIGLSVTDVEAHAFIDSHPHMQTIVRVLPPGDGWSPTPIYILIG